MGDRCAIYLAALVVQTSSACKDEKGGGPAASTAPPALKLPIGLKVPTTVTTPSATATASAAPSASATVATVPDAGVSDGGVKCDGTPTCSTVAMLAKDADHVYMRTCATGSVKIGDTWDFDESAWKKR